MEIKMYNINKIYKMLNWKNPIKTQLRGVELAEKVENLSLLIQPPAEPSVWELCAKVISQKNDNVLEPYLDELLEWLQDLNSPGALTILDRLKMFSGNELKERVENAVVNATKMPNEEGLRWLDYLSELLDNEKLKDALPREVIEKLQKHYHNWGAWCDD